MRKLVCLLSVVMLLALCACGEPPQAPAPETLRIAVVSDIHYTGEADFLYAGSFKAANDASGTGKQVEFLPALMDAFVAQMLRERPDFLLLTGDNSFNGARVSHEALLEKLAPLREAGIVILTLPGNHDIDGSALIFPSGEAERAESISAGDFAALYADCGFGAALSRDPASLSYVYDTGRGLRIFMLDTCFRYGSIYGRLKAETLEWLDRELALCREAGKTAIAAGHHNALVHNPLFAFDYTMDNGEALRELLMKNGVTLFLSGHLHPQSIAREDDFFDIATESFAVYPHRFALLELQDGSWRYTAHETDVESWARERPDADERLRNYQTWGRSFFYNALHTQAQASFSSVEDEALRGQLCKYFAEANINYFMGTPSAPAEGALAGAISQLGSRSTYYLQTITGIPDSLYAEGMIG